MASSPAAELCGTYEAGNGVAKNIDEARRWYEKAAAGGDANAMNNLGYLYQAGDGIA
jgi:uncharacterized protein